MTSSSEETADLNHPRKSYSTGSLGVVSEPCATAAEIEAALNDVEKQIMLETKVGKVVDVLSILLKSKSKFFLN